MEIKFSPSDTMNFTNPSPPTMQSESLFTLGFLWAQVIDILTRNYALGWLFISLYIPFNVWFWNQQRNRVALQHLEKCFDDAQKKQEFEQTHSAATDKKMISVLKTMVLKYIIGFIVLVVFGQRLDLVVKNYEKARECLRKAATSLFNTLQAVLTGRANTRKSKPKANSVQKSNIMKKRGKIGGDGCQFRKTNLRITGRVRHRNTTWGEVMGQLAMIAVEALRTHYESKIAELGVKHEAQIQALHAMYQGNLIEIEDEFVKTLDGIFNGRQNDLEMVGNVNLKTTSKGKEKANDQRSIEDPKAMTAEQIKRIMEQYSWDSNLKTPRTSRLGSDSSGRISPTTVKPMMAQGGLVQGTYHETALNTIRSQHNKEPQDTFGTEEFNFEESDSEEFDSEESDAEDSDAEDSDAEESDSEDSDAEESDSEDSDAEDSDAEESDGESDSDDASDTTGSSAQFGFPEMKPIDWGTAYTEEQKQILDLYVDTDVLTLPTSTPGQYRYLDARYATGDDYKSFATLLK